MSKCELNVGKVYVFQYLQGTHSETRIGRVVTVRDTYEKPLAPSTLRKHLHYARSRFLFGMRTDKGQHGQFYQHAILNATPVGFFGRIVLWFKGVRV